MIRKNLGLVILILCFGLIVSGCPKKTMVREEPSVKKAEESAAEKEKAARLEAERREKEAKEKELAEIKEEEAKKAQEEKEFEKSLVAKKTQGIAGEILETKLLKDIHFDFDKYEIRPEDALILQEDAALLMKHPTMKIQIEGHCDERGTVEYNLALGERRANNARKYLVSLGVSGDHLSTISYGKERPLDPAHNEEAWAKNRRDHLVILDK